MISIAQEKPSNLPAKLCAFGPKMKRILNNLKKILRFFDKKALWKIDYFHNFLLNISWISDSAPKV